MIDTTNQPPAAQPVAWMQLYRGVSKRFYDAAGFISRPDWGPETPLYATPDPRIAVLEGLLRDTQETLQKIKLRIHFIGWPAEPKREDGCVDWREEIAALEGSLKRIAAALKEGA